MIPNLLTQLEAERAKYGATMTNDQCIEMLNALAFRNAGFGLLKKDSGNLGTRKDGAKCSVDFLIWRATLEGIDCLSDAGGATRPQWGDPSETFPLDRYVAPIQPDGVTPPPPPPPPPPRPPDQEPVDLTPVLVALDVHRQLVREVLELARLNASALAAVQADLQALKQKLDNLPAAKPFPKYEGPVSIPYLGTGRASLDPKVTP